MQFRKSTGLTLINRLEITITKIRLDLRQKYTRFTTLGDSDTIYIFRQDINKTNVVQGYYLKPKGYYSIHNS